MSKRAAYAKMKELRTGLAIVEDLEVSIGRIFDEIWAEPVGSTPFPSMTDAHAREIGETTEVIE